jgi:hypothetical protein
MSDCCDRLYGYRSISRGRQRQVDPIRRVADEFGRCHRRFLDVRVIAQIRRSAAASQEDALKDENRNETTSTVLHVVQACTGWAAVAERVR